MPGICVIAASRSCDLAAQLGEMLRRMRHQPSYVEERYCDSDGAVALGRVSLGFVDSAAQPVCNSDRSLVAVLQGEVYDYAQQRRALEAAGRRFQASSRAELLLHGHESNGRGFVRDLHGTFAAAIWDRRTQRLIVTNDRFGMKPLYYAKLPGKLLVASEIKSLLVDPELPRQCSLRGVAQFFTYGQMVGEDTLLEAVRVLPAAGWLCYEVAEDRLTVDRYWRLESQSSWNGGAPDVLDQLDEAFGRAVERRVRDTASLGLSLSGGLDARTILAAIDHERVSVQTVSIGIKGSLDHVSASRLSALTNRRHHRCTLDEHFLARFEQHLWQMVHLTDGHYLSQCIVMPTLPTYRELGIEVLLRGHAGELMHMDKAYSFSLDREAWEIADEAGLEDWLFRHLQAYMLDGTDANLFAAPHAGHVESLARESLRECLRESDGMEPLLQRIWHLFITQRLRRETALSLVKFGSLMEVRLPYLDNELVDLVMSVPPELKLSDRIQSHILRRRRPEFLDVVNSNTGTRLGAGPLARFLGATRMKLLAKLGVRGYQPYERLGLWLRRELRPLVTDLLLSDRSLGRGLFDPRTVRSVVEGHASGRRNHTFLIMAMMIFELGQRELIDGDGVPESGPLEATSLSR